MPVTVIDTIKPKNNGSFPIVEAVDVAVTDELRLPEALEAKADVSALNETNATVSGKADASDVATATANLQGQINQIEISASAESVVAPEVAAARVSSTGYEYSTLKGRLDGIDVSVDSISSFSSVEDIQSKAGYITDTELVYWNASAHSLLYFRCLPFKKYIIKKMLGNEFAVCYIKTDPAASVPVYGYKESSSGTGTIEIVTGEDAKYILILAKYGSDPPTLADIIAQTDIKTVCARDDIARESIAALTESESALSDNVDVIYDATCAVEETSDTTDVTSSLVFSEGYINVAGNDAGITGYVHSSMISVEPGQVLNASVQPRCITAYNNGAAVAASGAAYGTIPYTVPEGIDGLVCTFPTSAPSSITISTITRQIVNSMKDDVLQLGDDISDLRDEMSEIPLDHINGIEKTGYNYIYDETEHKVGFYCYGSVGSSVSYTSNEIYDTVKIPVTNGNYKIVTPLTNRIRFIVLANTDDIITFSDNIEVAEYNLTVPEGFSGYVVITFSAGYVLNLDDIKISKDGMPPYNEYTVRDTWIFEKGLQTQTIHAHLPKYVYCAVGRTIELYNNQVCLEADKVHIQWVCDVGAAMKRKFSVTGTSQSTGEYSLVCNIYDDNKNVLWTGESTLVIVDDEISTSFSCVPIGDSLTNAKKWESEVINLSDSNVSYVGHYSATVQDADGVARQFRHEGRSGFTTIDYLIGSPYTFGGGDETEHNVFWNPTAERFDWSYYKTNENVDPDAVQIFLGTNELKEDNTNVVARFRQLVDYIRQDDASIPIYIVNTIYFGSQDGIGKQRAVDGYSAAQKGVWKFNQDLKVMDLMTRLDAEFDSDTNVIMINLAVSHDSEYNFGSVDTPVNPRAEQTEPMPTEAVHPQAQGYYQMADVIFSAYCANQ